MHIPPALVTAFPPSRELLLDVTRRQIDDDMLSEIAAADYGIDADQHLAALRPIRDTGIIPKLMGWHPGEVLELIRWSDPEDPDHKPGSTGRRGHQMRAFACAVLLSAASDGGYDSNEEATLAQCLSSARVLGDAMNDAVARFLTWRIPSLSCSDRWLFALGLLVVATRFRSDRITDEILAEAAAWFLDEESAFRRESGFNPADPPPAAFGLTHGFWKPLFSELIESAASIRSAKVRGDLDVIGKILQDQS